MSVQSMGLNREFKAIFPDNKPFLISKGLWNMEQIIYKFNVARHGASC